MLKVAGLHFENSAVGYYRMWDVFRQLNASNLAECSRLPDEVTLRRIKLDDDKDPLSIAGMFNRGAQLGVMQRISTLGNLSLMHGLRKEYGVPIIAECDDDLFSVEAASNAYSSYRDQDPIAGLHSQEVKPEDVSKYKGRKDGLLEELDGKMYFFTDSGEHSREWSKRFIAEADAVTTTTEHLANIFRKHNPYVYVLPNCVDVPRWDKARVDGQKSWFKRKFSKQVHVGWFGGMQHYDDLKIVRDVIPELLEKYPQMVFHMTSMQPDFWAHLQNHPRVIHHPYSPIQKWPEFLAGIGLDVAIAPLNSARFNLSKSNLKLLEYGMLKVPCVYSPVGPYKEVEEAREGIGWVAKSKSEWINCLSGLIENGAWRLQIGEQAHQYVCENYDIAKRIGDWRNVYEEVYNRSWKVRQREKRRLSKK